MIDREALPEIQNPWGDRPSSSDDMERIWSKSRTFAGDVWFRFRTRFNSLLGLCLILAVLAFAFIGPLFARFSYRDQNLEFVNVPPAFYALKVGDDFFYVTTNLRLIELDSRGRLLRSVERLSENSSAKQTLFAHKSGDILLDYSSKPYKLTRIVSQGDGKDCVSCVKQAEQGTGEGSTGQSCGQVSTERKFVWNKTYLMGSDSLGRDMMARLMYGARVSLLVAVTAALTNLLIGVLFGSISAYFGGLVDSVMMRIVDIISTLPLTLYVILIMVFLGSGLTSIIVALGSVYWVNMARVVRGEVLSLKERDFILASRTIGSSTWTILTRHLIPNAMGPILVTMTMLIPQAIFMEAFLSFIGLGIAPPLSSLGTMCSDSLATLRTSPYQLFEPALLICILMFGFNFVGDGLRDALDPKQRV